MNPSLELTEAEISELLLEPKQLPRSAILGYYLPMSGKLFRLRRYNGKSHEHSNTIEGERFYDFHIHIATERYQIIGADEDRYAIRTDRYTTLRQAFDCLRSDCALLLPDEEGQLSLL